MILASAISDLLSPLFEFTPGVAVGFNTWFFLLYHYNCTSTKLHFAFVDLHFTFPVIHMWPPAQQILDVLLTKAKRNFCHLTDNGCMHNEGSVSCMVPEK
jgi:hypothetical protein